MYFNINYDIIIVNCINSTVNILFYIINCDYININCG